MWLSLKELKAEPQAFPVKASSGYLVRSNLAGATGLEPAASCVTGRHLSSAVNRFLVLPHEISSKSPQAFHSVLAVAGATIETLSGETRRMSVAKYLPSS